MGGFEPHLVRGGHSQHLSRKPNPRPGKPSSSPGHAAKLEKQLPGSLAKASLQAGAFKGWSFWLNQKAWGSFLAQAGQDRVPNHNLHRGWLAAKAHDQRVWGRCP
jgi:hypothetical protein